MVDVREGKRLVQIFYEKVFWVYREKHRDEKKHIYIYIKHN